MNVGSSIDSLPQKFPVTCQLNHKIAKSEIGSLRCGSWINANRPGGQGMDKRDRAAIGGSNYMYMHLGHAARPSGPFISWPFTALLPVALSHRSHPIPSRPHPPTWTCKVLVLMKHDEGAMDARRCYCYSSGIRELPQRRGLLEILLTSLDSAAATTTTTIPPLQPPVDCRECFGPPKPICPSLRAGLGWIGLQW